MNNTPRINTQTQPQHWPVLRVLAIALALGFLTSTSQAVTYQWRGGLSTTWGTSGNWSNNLVAPTNGSFGHRLNINNTNLNSPNYECVYDASLGTTIYGAVGGRGLVIGTPVAGNFRMTGGTFATTNGTPAAQDVIVSGGAIPGTFTNDGGTYVSWALELGLNGGGAAIFTQNSGSSTISNIQYNFQGGTATVNLNGGTLTTRVINRLTTTPANSTYLFNFNGGTLIAGASSAAFMPTLNTNAQSRANVRDGGARIDTAGNSITIGQALLHSAIAGDAAIDGGLTKLGSGTLTLAGTNNYNGPTVVAEGTLNEPLPIGSASLTVASGAALTLTLTNAPWAMASAALTNSALTLNYGSWPVNSYTNAVLDVTNLSLVGTVTINLSGQGFPVTNLTLLTYGSKTGGGAFALGTLPSGAGAVLTDTGSSVVLQITNASIQSLIWTASFDSNWQTGGLPNWNSGAATYLEYPSGTGDFVIFDDSIIGGTVNIPGTVKPGSITVNDTAAFYNFNGSGKISGPTGINKLGSSTLDISTTNDFTGTVTVSGGTLTVHSPAALGSTNAATVVASGATVALKDEVTVVGEPITISGGGFGGVFGALRGADASNNVWAGPVVIAANSSRIGVDTGGKLTVSGNITDGGANYDVTFRNNTAGSIFISGASNTWGGMSAIIGTDPTGVTSLGLNNTLPINAVLGVGNCTLDLNGYSQTAAGLVKGFDSAVDANCVVVNNGGAPSTLTLNPLVNRSFPGSIIAGAGTLNLVKTGTNSQSLTSSGNTYTGSTVVSGGTLGIRLPLASSSLSLAEATALSVTVGGSSWSLGTMDVTNAITTFNFGTLAGAPTVPLTTTTLNVSGSNVVNVAGANFPLGPVTLIAYTTKNGVGTFHLGTLPVGMSATLSDTGSAIVLNVTFAPASLTWYGAATGTWNTNSTLDWNAGSAFYQEYTNGVGDLVTFNDAASVFTVNPVHDIRPFSATVSTTNVYTFSGAGKLSGSATLTKSGSGVLDLATPNSYTGNTTVSAGAIVTSTNDALGSTNGGTTIASGAAFGLVGGVNYSTTEKITGAGVGNTATNLAMFAVQRGIVQGVTGSNTFVGNIEINATGVTRFGVQDTAQLTLSGTITTAPGISNVTVLFRGGASNEDFITLAGSGNAWDGDTLIFTGNNGTGAGVRLGVDNGLSTTAGVLAGGNGTGSGTALDLAGFNQTLNGLPNSNGRLHIWNSSGALSTLTLNLTTADKSTFTTIANLTTIDDGPGAGKVALVKTGPFTQTLTSTNTYTGSTVVSNGTLLIDGVIDAGSSVSVPGGAFGGNGTVGGPVNVGAGGVLVPGGITTLGTLTISNTLSLGGAVLAQVNLDGGVTNNDKVIGLSSVAYGGTLVLTNVSATPLTAGVQFTLFSAAAPGTGSFNSIVVVPDAGLTGSLDASSGVVTLIATGPAIPTSPTNITFSVTSSNISIGWPSNYVGWILQTQTNARSAGLKTNWFDVAGSDATNLLTFPVTKTDPTVFFRLARTNQP